MTRTGVFASSEETEQVRASYAASEGAPLIFLQGLKTAEQIDDRIEQHKKLIDELARAHGLPDRPLIDGAVDHYGMMGSGEFITAD